MSCEGVVHLRRASPGDARAIAEVHVKSWRHVYRDQLPRSFLDALDVGRRESFWRSEVELLGQDNRPWVADAEGRVVGFVSVGPTRDDDAPVRTGEVYAIYVDPDCWDRGIGRNLLAHAVRDLRAHGYDRASLWVIELNEQARRFYDAAGWTTDGATKTDTIGGVDVAEVRYSRSLD